MKELDSQSLKSFSRTRFAHHHLSDSIRDFAGYEENKARNEPFSAFTNLPKIQTEIRIELKPDYLELWPLALSGAAPCHTVASLRINLDVLTLKFTGKAEDERR